MEWFLEFTMYATTGFWKFIGCYLLLLVVAYVLTHIVIKTLTIVFDFFKVISRGYAPAKPITHKCDCKGEKNK
jgi:hypothetical protein